MGAEPGFEPDQELMRLICYHYTNPHHKVNIPFNKIVWAFALRPISSNIFSHYWTTGCGVSRDLAPSVIRAQTPGIGRIDYLHLSDIIQQKFLIIIVLLLLKFLSYPTQSLNLSYITFLCFTTKPLVVFPRFEVDYQSFFLTRILALVRSRLLCGR